MIEIIPSEEHKLQALSEGEKMGVLNNSLMGGERNAHGMIGEILVSEALSAERFPVIFGDANFNYDIIHRGVTIDVKTKGCNSVPKKNYWCSITESNHAKQFCDGYVFCRVLEDLSRFWILGFISRENFLKTCRLFKKGDADPHMPKFKFDFNSYAVEVGSLNFIDSKINPPSSVRWRIVEL